MNSFADIIVPLSVPGSFTYRIPDSLHDKAAIGKRVIVPFGPQKLYSGLIIGLKKHADHPQVKDIVDIIDDVPLVNNIHLHFWQWICDYYLCYPGEVMHAALPSGIRFDSETRFSLLTDTAELDLTEEETIIAEALRNKHLTLKEIQKVLGRKNVYPLLKKMINENIITGEETLRNTYKPVIEKYYQLHESVSETELHKILDRPNARATTQQALLHEILALSETSPLIPRKKIMEKFPHAAASLKKLIERNIIREIILEKNRTDGQAVATEKEIILTTQQLSAYQEVHHSFKQHDVTLLHGITSSGKTHVYIKLIHDLLQQKMQVLYLLPEIALTTQIIRKLQSYFGNKVGVYHSKHNAHERVEIWNKVANETYQVILGARSALLLPFRNLGLIIVDEEHDGSYKQQDPAPRYQARDAAVMLGKISDAKVLLGTATPSLETYQNVKEGKYGIVVMKQRFLGQRLPEIIVVNTKEAQRKKQMQSRYSQILLQEIKEALNRKEQVILFQNRRGYAPYIQCADCEYLFKCRYCDVSLTYHKTINNLKCHWCGYTEKNPQRCHQCGTTNLKMHGTGTQKIEDEIAVLFPQAAIDRLDLDSARGKESHHAIIEKFEQQKTDILIGTQMVTKGLDFDHVSLVGIIDVDQMLHYPDFRSAERTFQLIMQVSGRAGRKGHHGKVILQTSRPDHPVVQFAATHDYEAFCNNELQQRQQFFYPPFSRMICIIGKHKDQNTVIQASQHFLKNLQLPASVRMLGPVTPVISRIKNLHLQHVYLKIPKNNVLLQQTKLQIELALNQIRQNVFLRNVQWQIDVDPI